MAITRDAVLDWMNRFAGEMGEHRQELVRLDTAIGDGDHGTNMDRGMRKAIEKLDKYHVLILEDLCYVRKDQAETSVLFELIAARYERRSLIVTANHPFGEWTSVFPDAAMTLAAVDRLVHHSTMFEMNVESYRRRVAAARAPRKPRGVNDSKSDSGVP